MGLSSDAQGRLGVKTLRPRIFGAMVLLGLAFVGLWSRLYTLQIIRGEELSVRGERNFVQRVVIPHDRGIIYDRFGRILVDNRQSLDLQIIPAFLGKADERRETLERLALLLQLDDEGTEEVQRKLARVRGGEVFVPIVVKRDLNPREIEAVEADRSIFRLDGVEIVEGRRRTYRYGSNAAHLLGYVNEIDPGRLEYERGRGNPRKYKLGDVLGRSGVERTFEAALRGSDGYEKVVVDAKGRREQSRFVQQLLEDSRRVEPVPGHNVILTLDHDLQRAAEAAFDGAAGAVVALNPHTGAILAQVSMPSFDPNKIGGTLARAEKARLDSDVLKPWLNRPIQGQYAPGSTFKVVTGAAALQAGVSSPREKVFCPGYYRMGRHTWRCHKDSGHGYVDLKMALKYSCDTWFYTMAGRMGIEPIAQMARRFGFGSRTGIALQHEQPGLAPDEAFHNRVDAKTGGYQKGMAVNTSIGQGSLLVTPMQLAVAYAAVANGGTVFTPRFVDRVESADFRVIRRYLPEAHDHLVDLQGLPGPVSEMLHRDLMKEEVRGQPPMVLQALASDVRSELGLSEEHLKELEAGLIAVASEPGGTAYYRRSRLVTMAGKTGTTQVVRLGKNRLKAEQTPYFERDHAWFAAFAPAEEPEIVVAVINEHSGHGSSKAAPIAVRVIDAYFELQKARQARAAATVGGETP